MFKKLARSLFLPAVLCAFLAPVAMTGCGDSSDDGPKGPTGPTGPTGTVVLSVADGAGAYISQGTDGVGTATTLGGSACTEYTGTTMYQYSNTNFELQYSIPESGTVDLTSGTVKLTYDLWIASATENLNSFQVSAWNSNYTPKYWNDAAADIAKLDQWQSVSITLDPAAEGYKGDGFDATKVALVRIKNVSGTASDDAGVSAGSAVDFCIKNIQVTKY